MFSQLHARKKAALGVSHHQQHESTEADTELGQPQLQHHGLQQQQQHHNHNQHHATHHEEKGKLHRKQALAKEVKYAFSSVSLFLAFGLFLGYFLMHHRHRKVIYHVLRDPVGHGRGMLQGRVGFRHHFYSGPPRYVTVVLPSVVRPEMRKRRLNSIQDTWGPAARAIYVVHNVTEFPQAKHAIISEKSQPEDPYAFPQLLMLPGEINVEDGLQRLFHTIRAIHDKVNPDFAFFVNDHTFVIPTHVCKYLENKKPSEDLYAGRTLGNEEIIFNSGAAGYILSRETMRKLIEKWNAQYPGCVPSREPNKWEQGNPGLLNAKCLKSMDIQAIDTRAREKWHRFHAFPLTRVVSGKVDDWYQKKHKQVEDKQVYRNSYGTLLRGPDCCSPDTISFHYVEWKESLALFAVREEILKNPYLSDHELKTIMLTEWPRNPSDIGFYSLGLPTESNEDAWNELLATIRKISTRATQRDC